MSSSVIKTDYIGAIAGTLCLIHCAITPFVFIAKACTDVCCESAPTWWKMIDFVFLIISFLAIYQTTKNTNKPWLNRAFWISWLALCLLIFNEQLLWMKVDKLITYFPALLIIVFHLYSLKYCKCSKNTCFSK